MLVESLPPFTNATEVKFKETAEFVLVVAHAVSGCILKLLEVFLFFHQSTRNH